MTAVAQKIVKARTAQSRDVYDDLTVQEIIDEVQEQGVGAQLPVYVGPAGETISITAGVASTSTLGGGAVQLLGGAALTGATGGYVNAYGGYSSSDSNGGGPSGIYGGRGGTGGYGGSASVQGGDSGLGVGGALIRAQGGFGLGGGGACEIVSGNAASTSGKDGGDVRITTGSGDGAGRNGLVIVSALPTADPHVAGALWLNAGVVTQSAG